MVIRNRANGEGFSILIAVLRNKLLVSERGTTTESIE